MNLSRLAVIKLQYLRLLLVLLGLGLWGWSFKAGENFFTPWAWVLFLGFFLSGVAFLILQRKIELRFLLWAELILDVFLVSLLILASGRRESPFVFLYPLLIFLGTLHVGRRGADILTFLTLSCYLFFWLWPPFPEIKPETLIQFFISLGAMGASGLLALRFAEEIARNRRWAEETQAALYRIEELYQHIMRSMASGLIITDLEGRITSANQKAREILGFPLEGKKLREILSEIHLNKAQHRSEIVIYNKERRYLGYSLFPLKDEKDQIFGYGFLFQDITHIKEQEKKLREAERLAALGTMAAGLVHEIKNPLASISGAIQLLKEGELVQPQGLRLLNILERESARLDELVTNFLFFAKPSQGEAKEVNLHRICQEIREELSCRKDFSRLRFELSVPEEMWVKVEPGRFKQVLLNLCFNACQACQNRPQPTVEMRLLEENGSWALLVQDNGEGIPKDILPRIFEPFFTTKPHGTGLGLSVVYSLVKAWGGRIEVESEPGKGSTFKVIFPSHLIFKRAKAA